MNNITLTAKGIKLSGVGSTEARSPWFNSFSLSRYNTNESRQSNRINAPIIKELRMLSPLEEKNLVVHHPIKVSQSKAFFISFASHRPF